MNYKTITYQRVKNLGNYESERLEMTIELNEGENPLTCADALRLDVNYILNQTVPDPKPLSKKVEEGF
ncbi:MAG: hypothetical protein KME31_06630 [Tolypothrix carrinoi HA7290-LM1]|jgi:hypothetical protein|nr:hypothetical protein [Tolypothrix carrinoi HA7290-LM1]